MKITNKPPMNQAAPTSKETQPTKVSRPICRAAPKDSYEKTQSQPKVPFFSPTDLRFRLNVDLTGGGRAICVASKALKQRMGALGQIAEGYCSAFDAGRKTDKSAQEPSTLTKADAAAGGAKLGAVGAQEALIRSKLRTARPLARRSALEVLGQKPAKGRAGLNPQKFAPEINKKADQIAKQTVKQGKRLLRLGKDVTDSALKERIQQNVADITKRQSAAGQIAKKTAPAFRAVTRTGRFLTRAVPVLNWANVAIDTAKYKSTLNDYMKNKASLWKLGFAAVTAGLSVIGAKVPLVGWGAAAAGLARDVVK